MVGGGGVRGRRQERRPLQRMVRILLECILVHDVSWGRLSETVKINLNKIAFQ